MVESWSWEVIVFKKDDMDSDTDKCTARDTWLLVADLSKAQYGNYRAKQFESNMRNTHVQIDYISTRK